MAVETPLETKGLLVRVALAGSVSKGILAAQAVAMARSLLIRLTPSQNPLEHMLDRLLKISAIVFVLVLSISLGYYFMVFLPAHQKQTQETIIATQQQQVRQQETAAESQIVSQQEDRRNEYRKECVADYKRLVKEFGDYLKSLDSVTEEQINNIAKGFGLVDEDGYSVTENQYAAECVDRKEKALE